MRKTRFLVGVVLTAVLVTAFFSSGQVSAYAAPDVTDGSLDDWAAIPNHIPDPIGDVSGSGQYDLVKLWVANDATYLYVRWDIKLAAQNTAITSAAYGLALNTNGVAGADAVAWASFDSKGNLTISVENPIDTITQLPTSSIWGGQVNTGVTHVVASVEAKFPLSNLGVTSTSVVPVWGESHPSPSLKSNVKDIVPNSGTMILDLGTGLWAPDGSVPGLIDISKRVDQATVAGSGVVTYTIDLVNVGGSAATVPSLVDELPSGFIYVTGSSSGITTVDPTITTPSGVTTLTWTLAVAINPGVTRSQSFRATVPNTLGTYYDNASYQIGTAPTETGDTAPVTVNHSNQAPTLASISGQSGAEGSAVSLATSGTDPDAGDTLTYSVSGQPAGLSINSSTGLISGTIGYQAFEDQPVGGHDHVSVTVTDNHGVSASQTFDFTVSDTNRAPTLATISSQSGAEGDAVSLATSGSDPDPEDTIAYSISGQPTSLSINPSTGLISGTIGYQAFEDQPVGGHYHVSVTVSDNHGASASQTFDWTLADTNRPPAYTGASTNTSQTIAEGAGLAALAAADPDSDPLSYSLTSGSLPTGLTLNADGTFSGTAAYTAAEGGSPAGRYSATITVSDGKGGTDTTTLPMTVTDTNRPPAYTGAAANTSQTIAEGAGLAALVATDPDSDPLSYSLTSGSLPTGLTLNADGTFSGTADYDAAAGGSPAGSYSAIITVSDGKGGTDITTLAMTVTDTNRPPAYTGAATNTSQTIAEGAGLAALVATDPDSDPLSYSLTGGALPTGITLNADGTFSGAAAYTAAEGGSPAGSYSATIQVSDGKGGTDTTTLDITVNNTDTAPALADPPDRTDDEGDTISLQLIGSDADGDTLTYSALNLPDGLSLNPTTGLISGTLSYSSAGVYVVTVTVEDDTPAGAVNSASQTFTWRVRNRRSPDEAKTTGVLRGVVVDNETGQPLAGLTVEVFADRDGNGVLDFSATCITDAQGAYQVTVPWGNTTYGVRITRPVRINGVVGDVEFEQVVHVGAFSDDGQTVFSAGTSATGLLTQPLPDGSERRLPGVSGFDIDVMRLSGSGAEVDAGLQAYLAPGGLFSVSGLTPGTSYVVKILRELPTGEEIVVGRVDVTVDENGETRIGKTQLVDPCGTVTDADTAAAIRGAEVTLRYADTARNWASGVIPGAVVSLPVMDDLPPAGNANPQLSDTYGKFAYMVYPHRDYYLTATKAGYEDYQSLVIPVEDGLIKHDIQMHRSVLAINLTVGGRVFGEGSVIEFVLEYENRSTAAASDVLIRATIPAYTGLVDCGAGTFDGSTISWTLLELGAGETGTLTYSVLVGDLPAPEVIAGSGASISCPPGDVRGRAEVEVLLFSNCYGPQTHRLYIIGYPDGEFKPAELLTRAQVATVFMRIMGLENLITGDPLYSDVDPAFWAADAIEAATRVGLMEGYTDGTFHPNQPISRAELATIAARAMGGAEVSPISSHFQDVGGHWALDFIEGCYRGSVVRGYEDSTFLPDALIPRAEAVTIINRLFYRGPLLSQAASFPDVGPGQWFFGQVEESAQDHSFLRNEDGSESKAR